MFKLDLLFIEFLYNNRYNFYYVFDLLIFSLHNHFMFITFFNLFPIVFNLIHQLFKFYLKLILIIIKSFDFKFLISFNENNCQYFFFHVNQLLFFIRFTNFHFILLFFKNHLFFFFNISIFINYQYFVFHNNYFIQ